MSKDPHPERRRRILAAHPSVSSLQGPEWRSKWICAALVASQTGVAVLSPSLPSPLYFAVAYLVGATLAQALFLAVHELSHDLFFRSSHANRLFAIFANLPAAVPFATSFRFYHLLHHRHQGVEGLDTDLPSALEVRLASWKAGRAAWVALQIVAYALRPPLTLSEPPSRMHALNWAAQACYDAALVAAFGWGPVRFLLLSVLLAGGLHPCAGHFLAEHALHDAAPGQETYSYYGPLNGVTWNVGYHNEHHDFPRVAWSRLPLLRASAPEFYDSLSACPSWSGALLAYVSDAGPPPRRARRRPARESPLVQRSSLESVSGGPKAEGDEWHLPRTR